MREDFLSFDDISKKEVGFQFYNKNEELFELLLTKTKTIHVAHGILGDKYQDVTFIEVMDENGETYKTCNVLPETNGGNIYNIAYIEDEDWYKLSFKTVESVNKKRKDAYANYLKEELKAGNITELEMYKLLADG